jgi:predicted Rossmann fold nucleotide-binding protein DprA/Smf involved in DNA uptake
MSLEGTVIDSTHPDYPVALRDKKGHALFPRVWAVGNLALLERPLIGFFCSVKCPGDLILRTYDLARSLRDNGVTVIGGFHSPIEKDCLDLLIKGSQPIVLCPARSIENMLVRKMFRQPLDEGRLLFLSPFEKKIKRQTTQISQVRNQFVCTMAKAVFVSHAEAKGKIEEISKEILSSNKPLYTFESEYNKTLIEMGAQPVKTENLNAWATALNVEPLFVNKS